MTARTARTARSDDVIEVIDETENRRYKGGKLDRSAASEFGTLTKAAAIYFEKLHDLHEASASKRRGGSATEFLSNLDKANRAAWKYVVDNSNAHKENEKLATRFLPDSAIDDLHDWLDDSDD
jgi:hypothetical protein